MDNRNIHRFGYPMALSPETEALLRDLDTNVRYHAIEAFAKLKAALL